MHNIQREEDREISRNLELIIQIMQKIFLISSPERGENIKCPTFITKLTLYVIPQTHEISSVFLVLHMSTVKSRYLNEQIIELENSVIL